MTATSGIQAAMRPAAPSSGVTGHSVSGASGSPSSLTRETHGSTSA